MKQDFVKLAVIGLMAGFCLSAQQAASKGEVAMMKCSKDKAAEPQKKCNGKSECNSCSGPNGCNSEDQQSDASQAVKSKRKSAAQKVVEGE